MPIDLNPSRPGLLWTASAVGGLSLSPAWMRQAKAQKSGGTPTVALSNYPITSKDKSDLRAVEVHPEITAAEPRVRSSTAPRSS